MSRNLNVGESMVINEIFLSDELNALSFELKRFSVFSPEARIEVNEVARSIDWEQTVTVYLKGTISDISHSWVVLSIREDDTIRGLAYFSGQYWAVVGGGALGGPQQGLMARQYEDVDFERVSRPFDCVTDKLAGTRNSLAAPPTPPQLPFSAGTSASYTAQIAIETDYDYLQKFGGDIDAASDYAADLIAFSSGIYSLEIDTALVISHISLWSDPDPYTQSSSNCLLFEFGRYWNDNRADIPRTTAHFLSGKSTGGGVAWVGVLCSGSFNYAGGSSAGCPSLVPNTDNYGGAYGFTGGISGNFDIQSPTAIWDIIATAHEIGHNFNSPHTHCYAGLGGEPEPVDTCYGGQCGTAGCHCGSTGLPGPPSSGAGTIMSYCHFQGGGFSNIAFTFGLGHPYGVAPDRVPERMNDHVVNQFPEVTSQPDSQTLCVGEPLTLAVSVSGAGSLAYKWQKDGLDLPGADQPSLSIANVTMADAGVYLCIVSDSCGMVCSENASVSVQPPLTVPRNVFVQGLDAISLEADLCHVTDWNWLNLDSGQIVGTNQNPILLDYLDATTSFEIQVDSLQLGLITDQYLVLVSENHIYQDNNGDGCNSVEDLWEILSHWRTANSDGNGDGYMDIRDYLYVNTEETVSCLSKGD